MLEITPIAIVSGLIASMIFMTFGWTLAQILSDGAGIFSGFTLKLIFAAMIGIIGAPVLEKLVPASVDAVMLLEQERQKLPDYIETLSEKHL